MSGEKRASALAALPCRSVTFTAVSPGRNTGVTFVGSGLPVFERSRRPTRPETKQVGPEVFVRRSRYEMLPAPGLPG